MWMFNGKFRILGRNGKQFVYVPSEIIKTPALTDVGKTVQEMTNLKQVACRCKQDEDEKFLWKYTQALRSLNHISLKVMTQRCA